MTALALLASTMALAPARASADANDFVGGALEPGGDGHWLVNSFGQVLASNAGFFGDMTGTRLNKPVVGMAATPTANGYWLVASDGGIFSFGDARFFGSTGSIRLNQPIVGMASTASGNGYWLVASDGGIFAYGDAQFFGSTGSIALNKPVVGMASTASGNGYWLVASDGGIFAYGDAQFFGSTGSIQLNRPITGMSATASGSGYWLVASDGGIFAFGDAPFLGSGANHAGQPAVAIVRNGADGYAMLRADGSVLRTTRPAAPSLPAPPASNAPVTTPPATTPPISSPPATTPPATTPPATTPPATTPPPTVPPVGDPQPALRPSGVTGDWNLAFQDEFDGDQLDRSKWGTCYIWATNGCTNAGNNELQWYLPGNVSQAGGSLHMTAKRETVTGSSNKVFNYTSGMVTTGPHQPTHSPAKFEFTYGYVEARVKVPKGKALWPAVWLLPSTGAWPPEIDVMEIIGDETNQAVQTFHWSENGTHRQSGGGWRGPDFSAEYHTFGVDWQPTHITWYIDGVARRSSVTNQAIIPNEPMYVLLNLAVGGDWPGAPDANTPFPSTYSADWVRVWKKA